MMETDLVNKYDNRKFSFEVAINRFLEIGQRSLVVERKVGLYPGEYDEFLLELERRQRDQVLRDHPH